MHRTADRPAAAAARAAQLTAWNSLWRLLLGPDHERPDNPDREAVDESGAAEDEAPAMIADVASEAARRQQARLDRLTVRSRCAISSDLGSTPSAGRKSRWVHVPLAELFAEQGNRICERSDGRMESGHEPHHSSRSGRCVLITKTSGIWFCRSCRRGGDAATLIMQLRGCSYHEAAEWLTERYGPPSRGPRHGRVVWLEA